MIDFSAIARGETSLTALESEVGLEQLAPLTNQMIDEMLERIAEATDAMVTFVPDDPEADDPYAADEGDKTLAWTLGHVVVHTTASAEEAAFLAAEMARGVRPRGRSRAEVPWQEITTIAQCRHRLEESRRMRLASLEMWPDDPHIDNTFSQRRGQPPIGPIGRFLLGLLHDHAHVDQLSKIVAQAEGGR